MFNAKLANHIFAIENKYKYTENLFKDYIIDGGQAEFEISVTDSEIMREKTNSASRFSPEYLESLAVYRKICDYLIDKGVILFHCSALEIDGEAYLFTAPSGTGKSTHTRLWRKHFGDRVTMINDDKPLLMFSPDGQITVFGTPYMGKENIGSNSSAVVGGIVILAQAKENSIKRMTAHECFPALLNQAYRSTDAGRMIKTLDMVSALSGLPVYKLECNISDEAVILAYNALKGNK